jgi:trehalose/maltose hydrolase-like predicted phosphorylase
MYLLRKAKIIYPKKLGYTVSLNHKNTLSAAEKVIQSALALGYDQLLEDQRSLVKIWEMSDITIEGDVKHSKEFVLISFNSTKPT